jgi:hypothetical protein
MQAGDSDRERRGEKAGTELGAVTEATPAARVASSVASRQHRQANVYSGSRERHMRTLHLRDRRIVGFHSYVRQWAPIVCLMFPSALYGEQITWGTIIITAQTKHYIVMAGDSRGGESEDGITIKSTSDCECKLAALGGDTAFGAAGVIGDHSRTWTAVSVANDAAAPIIKGSRIGSVDGDRILENWANLMLQRLSAFSAAQLLAVANKNEGIITTGILAGIEADGTPWLHSLKINYSILVGLRYQGYVMRSNDPPTAYYNLGKSEIAMEFEESKSSKRAIRERARWGRMKLNGLDFDRFKTRRLVELTIQFHPDRSEVGGRIDEIELDPKGIRWIALKQNCRQGDAKAPVDKTGKGISESDDPAVLF